MLAAEILSELAVLTDPKVLAANQKRGDNHGVNLSKLRALAKKARNDHDRAKELWATEDTGARLVALLTATPKNFSADELDAMLRGAQGPKEIDWLENYIIAKSPLVGELEQRWRSDPDPHVEAAAWKLLNRRVGNTPETVDLAGVLTEIEERMAGESPRLQWAMNEALANIGITQPEYRARAIAIGEALQVLADYPVSKGCVSPFAPVWIREMSQRAETL